MINMNKQNNKTMKKVFLLLLSCLIVMGVQAQNDKPMQLASSSVPNRDAKFLLFPTQNYHIFLKLNTRTGEVSMVQFSIDGKEGEVKIKSFQYPLVTKEEETNGRFFLYPTTNIFNFLLIDQIDGRVWQVQWNFDEDKRFLTRIYNENKVWSAGDKILKKSLEYRDKVYYLDGELFNGEAFLDEDYTVSMSYRDGRIRYQDMYAAFHDNGQLAFIFNTGKEEDSFSYEDEKGERISKEDFITKYPELLTKVKKVMGTLKNQDQAKKNSVTSQVKKSPKK